MIADEKRKKKDNNIDNHSNNNNNNNNINNQNDNNNIKSNNNNSSKTNNNINGEVSKQGEQVLRIAWYQWSDIFNCILLSGGINTNFNSKKWGMNWTLDRMYFSRTFKHSLNDKAGSKTSNFQLLSWSNVIVKKNTKHLVLLALMQW